jgi:hypothetical protein
MAAFVIAVIIIDSFSQVAGLKYFFFCALLVVVTIGVQYRNRGGGLSMHFCWHAREKNVKHTKLVVARHCLIRRLPNLVATRLSRIVVPALSFPLLVLSSLTMVCPPLPSPPITSSDALSSITTVVLTISLLVSHRRYPSRTKGLDSQVQIHSTQSQCCARRQDQQAKVDHGGSGKV